MATEIDVKFSEFIPATELKDADKIPILQDGQNKIIQTPVLESKIINKTVSRVIDQGGASLNVINLKGVVPTYADLATITPTPELNDAYQVEADGLVYVYTDSGFQADGDGFVVQPEPIGVVEEGNTQAVSGGEVYNKIEVINDLIASLSGQIGSGIIGEAFPATIPISEGFGIYTVSTSGAFVNFKDVNNDPLIVSQADLDSGLVQLWGNNNIWEKHVTIVDVFTPVFSNNLSDI